MQHSLFGTLVAAAAVTTACVIPPGTLSNTITTGFGILIQNPAFPVIHDRYMNLNPAGGGDQHLFLDPVGDRTFNLVLNAGALAQNIIHAVINGEVK
jgi:kremen protein